MGIRNPNSLVTRGWYLPITTSIILLPEEQFKDFVRPEQFIPNSPGQHEEWSFAIQNGNSNRKSFQLCWVTEL